MMTSITHLPVRSGHPRRTKLMRATDAFPSRVTPQADPGRATLRRKANPPAAAARRVSPPGSSDATPHARPAPYPQVNISRKD
jgi:hypothetical protein